VPPIITLLTDFGVESTYPAQMKGVILGRCPSAAVVDLSHGVPHHDVQKAAFMLASASPAFPPGTIHLAVVDPHVGTQRRILAAEACGHIYLAPDNGLLTLVTQGGLLCDSPTGGQPIFSVENQRFFRTEVSSTFHGRDIFAPVAAALAEGAEVADLGPPVDSIERFDVPKPRRQLSRVSGQVLYLDPFGNLVTNIPGSMLAGQGGGLTIHLCGAVVHGLSKAYSDVPAGLLLAYIGSAGLLEIAVNRQSAAMRLGAEVGTPLTVDLSA
jgi:S-adenosyl-L-methionine hydrolase (adenosine-forming)